jgi:hypothetical protein
MMEPAVDFVKRSGAAFAGIQSACEQLYFTICSA